MTRRMKEQQEKNVSLDHKMQMKVFFQLPDTDVHKYQVYQSNKFISVSLMMIMTDCCLCLNMKKTRGKKEKTNCVPDSIKG